MSAKAKPLHGLGGGVMEIAANDESGTYRAVYTVSIGDSIYVIHAFQKKVEGRERHTEARNGSDKAAAQAIAQ